MTAWIRFRHEGAAVFGTLTSTGVSVHDGEMFGHPRPNGRIIALD